MKCLRIFLEFFHIYGFKNLPNLKKCCIDIKYMVFKGNELHKDLK
jgi:hypothetical protein